MSAAKLSAKDTEPVTVLSIAGSDASGGAGIQADLRAFGRMGVRGATVLTAVTAQNDLEVRAVHVVPVAMVTAQMDAVFDGMSVRAVKLGMLARASTIRAVAAGLVRYRPPFVVLDPVMVSSSGRPLLAVDAVDTLMRRLLPLVDCLTPNLHEAAALLGVTPAIDEAGMQAQGRALLARGAKAVLIKGGHAPLSQAVDWLLTPAGAQRFASEWVRGGHCRGTGCTLSSAIAAAVARGASLSEAVARAKSCLLETIRSG